MLIKKNENPIILYKTQGSQDRKRVKWMIKMVCPKFDLKCAQAKRKIFVFKSKKKSLALHSRFCPIIVTQLGKMRPTLSL